MPVKGKPLSYYKKFKFVVEIDKFESTGFQKCSKLESETTVTEQWEGGSLIADKSPARVKHTDVTLDRGASKSLDMYNWYQEVTAASANTGVVDDAYKRTVDVVQQDRAGNTLRRWRLFKAWPSKYSPGEWDNTSDDNLTESLTLVFDYFDLVPLAARAGGASHARTGAPPH